MVCVKLRCEVRSKLKILLYTLIVPVFQYKIWLECMGWVHWNAGVCRCACTGVEISCCYLVYYYMVYPSSVVLIFSRIYCTVGSRIVCKLIVCSDIVCVLL